MLCNTNSERGDFLFQTLSDSELMIMEYLWSANIPKTFSEIKTHFDLTTDKKWKKQTLNTFLLRLSKKDIYSPIVILQKLLIIL